MSRLQFVADNSASFEVKRLCELVEIERSSCEVFQMGSVRTSIIGRPRPSPPDRRARNSYTLICDEPRYVPDTDVVSALRVRGRNPSVETWVGSVPVTDQFVTATTISEIERGVIAKERSDPAQGEVLRRWFEDRVLPAFAGRVLSFDLVAARILATYYRVPERAPLDDALIAAVAQAADMTVVTRNVSHFEPLGVTCLNPWSGSS